jgi:hypothetical protein
MSFWSVFKRRRELTAQENQMSDKLTLDKARELLTAKDTEIQGLNARVAEAEQAFNLFGIERTEADGKVTFTSSRVAELETKVGNLAEENETLAAAFNKSQTELGAAQTKAAELEKKDNGVSARAREFLAGQGGKPLNISDRTGFEGEMTEIQLHQAIEAEKDPVRRKALFNKLQELEKKNKSR